MVAKQTSPLDHINRSGFPFQIALNSLIERTSDKHHWKVEAEELYWKHPYGESGYIDLVVNHSSYAVTLVVECKRVVQDGQWFFMSTGGRPKTADRMSMMYAQEHRKGEGGGYGWAEFACVPHCEEVNYCVVPKDEKNPMLEHIADSLLPSTEALGYTLAESKHRDACGNERYLLPVIVTNARLVACDIDPTKMDMKAGILPEDGFRRQDVRMVRFRKNLKSHFGRIDGPHTRTGVLRLDTVGRDRTIMVINAEELPGVLAEFRFLLDAIRLENVRLRRMYVEEE